MKKEKNGLWDILKPVSKDINSGYILAGFSSAFFVANLSLLSFILAALIQKSEIWFLGFNLNLAFAVFLVGVFSILASILSLLAFRISHLGAFKLEQILRNDLSRHLSILPLGFIISNGSGALKKVFLDDVKNLHAFVADSTPLISKSLSSAVLSLVVLLLIDYKMALVSVLVLLFGGILMGSAMRDSAELRKQYEQGQANINKAIIEFVQAMPVVRTFDDGSTSFRRYHNSLESFRETLHLWLKTTSFSARISLIILSPLPTLIAVLFAGIYFTSIGELEIQALIAALFLSTGMCDSFMPLMFMFNHIKKSEIAAKSIQEILALKPLKECKNPQIPKDSSVEFENVSFAYDEHEVLKNISFKVKPNTTTAIVGTSGAGKSTIAKLIPRFWDIKSGVIKLGGVDISEISYDELMKHISFVFQDTFLFNDTILNNIKMANQNATDEEVKNAAKLAQIHNFIESLELGYHTKVSDRGSSLSGGQKQRITIARAILRNTPIILLDEATAFADPENEEEIIKALSNLIQNKTLIIIAHRLSTIKKSSQILVLDNGEIAEKGTHKSLLEDAGIYKNLWGKYLIAQNWEIGVKNAK